MASTLGSISSLQSLGYNGGVDDANGSALPERSEAVAANATKPPKDPPTKYRHIAAIHSRSRISLLSSDHEGSTSFVGFRNLMVIVLSKYMWVAEDKHSGHSSPSSRLSLC